MKIPLLIPQLDFTDEVRLQIEKMSTSVGFRIEKIADTRFKVHIGQQLIFLNASSLHRRLLAELAELAGSRICYGFNEHMYFTLRRLSEPVLIRAVNQGLRQRQDLS